MEPASGYLITARCATAVRGRLAPLPAPTSVVVESSLPHHSVSRMVSALQDANGDQGSGNHISLR